MFPGHGDSSRARTRACENSTTRAASAPVPWGTNLDSRTLDRQVPLPALGSIVEGPPAAVAFARDQGRICFAVPTSRRVAPARGGGRTARADYHENDGLDTAAYRGAASKIRARSIALVLHHSSRRTLRGPNLHGYVAADLPERRFAGQAGLADAAPSELHGSRAKVVPQS